MVPPSHRKMALAVKVPLAFFEPFEDLDRTRRGGSVYGVQKNQKGWAGEGNKERHEVCRKKDNRDFE